MCSTHCEACSNNNARKGERGVKEDAASRFWQIPLHPGSCSLTTFITPFGRYCFRRLPFGISSAPEIFQRKMQQTLQGLEGVQVFMDDILVYVSSLEQHDSCLEQVLKRVESAGLILNPEKCTFRQSQLRFLGHLINETVVRPDPEKVEVIRQLTPKNTYTETRMSGRRVGM